LLLCKHFVQPRAGRAKGGGVIPLSSEIRHYVKASTGPVREENIGP
jgi:hypothetical protein